MAAANFHYMWADVMEAIELIPCPFCGFHLSAEDDDCIYPVNQERTLWGVHCYSQGGGCSASVLGDTKEEAIANWNRRVPSLGCSCGGTPEPASDSKRSLSDLDIMRGAFS